MKAEFIGGDCLSVLESSSLTGFGNEDFDIIVTSPPYNLGIDYGIYKDDLDMDEYLSWTRQWAGMCMQNMKRKASLFVVIGGSNKEPLIPHQVVLELSRRFELQNTFHWIKSITVHKPGGEPLSVGHFKPINSKRFVNECHEYVFHLTLQGDVSIDRRGAGVPYADKSNLKRWAHTGGVDKRCRGNNWYIPYDTIQSRAGQRPHPATFPKALVEQCIRLHNPQPGFRMLDPFVGIGTSALAAQAMGCGEFVGVDLNPEYLRVAKTSLEEAMQ